MRPTGSTISAGAAAILAAVLLPAVWAADGTLHKIPLVEMEIRPLSAPPGAAHQRLELAADRPGSVEFDSEWQGVGKVRVKLSARARPTGEGQTVRFQAELTLPGGKRVHTFRESVVRDHGTILFELFREDGRPFTLAIEATVSETWEVVRRPSIGNAVRFEVEVVRINGSSRTSLERNILQTFEGQTVGYEFKLGPKPTDDALTLRLTPVRIVGELLEIRVNLDGRVGVGGEVTVIGREDTVIVSRDRATPVDAVAGEPGVGYRFELTPRF